MNNENRVDTVIVGAGPFGLSIGAHLRASGSSFRIFGRPMHRWLNQMPVGMFLKSDGRASNLSDPSGQYTLGRYCAENNLPYQDHGLPVPIETFTRYALAFQRQLLPAVEEVYLSKLSRLEGGFDLEFENGDRLTARNVVIATGLEHTAYVPPVLRPLSERLRSHCSEHRDLGIFRDRDVTVIGGGQSALEIAALLAEAGAQARVVVRKPSLQWNSAPALGTRPLYRRLRYPVSNLGEGTQLWFYSNLPKMFRYFPRDIRIRKAHSVLDAAGACWLKNRVEGKIQIKCGAVIRNATARDGRIALTVSGADQGISEILTDHVIAATGYQYDIRQLPFLNALVKDNIRAENGRPVLSSHFESTVPGLYFTGLASAYDFGPSMRFLDGARQTALIISRRIQAVRERYSTVPNGRAAAASN